MKASKWRCPTGEFKPASTWVGADRLHPLIPRETNRWGDLYCGRWIGSHHMVASHPVGGTRKTSLSLSHRADVRPDLVLAARTPTLRSRGFERSETPMPDGPSEYVSVCVDRDACVRRRAMRRARHEWGGRH